MSRNTVIFIIALLLLTLGAVVFIKNPRPYKIAWASVALDNKEHYLPCQDLPFYLQVEKAVAQHQDAVDKLKKIDGVISVEPVLNKCYTVDGSNYFNKGDLLIDYKSHKARQAVRQVIGDNFFGIPYRGHRK